jgi:hemerythrin
MPFIDWKPSMSVGVELLDSQHKQLLSLINSLHDQMKAGKGRLGLPLVVKELVSYTKVHFGSEESLMKNAEFPTFASHKAQHEEFVRKIVAIEQQLRENSLSVTFETMDFLQKWLINHIQNTDQQYKPYLKNSLS